MRLTAMQVFFFETISKSKKELNPSYLAYLYYESIGKVRRASSRDSFGQTSAAYRTCRFLASAQLIKETKHQTAGGISYSTYSAK